MKKNQTIPEGAKLKYTGKGFDEFEEGKPYMTFLGYDTPGWSDLWVEYLDKKMCISLSDVELADNLL